MSAPLQADLESTSAMLVMPARPIHAAASARSWVAVGFVLSLLAHAGVLAATVWRPAVTDAGGGGTELEAIGVELVSSAVFETQIAIPSARASAVDARVELEAGTPDETVQLLPQEQVPQKPDSPEQLLPVVSTPAANTADSMPPPEQPPPPERAQAVIESKPAEAPALEEMIKGGARSAGHDESIPAGGVASASPGAIQKYAGEIRTALAKARPKGRGGKGTVTVTFSITATGRIGDVNVAKSSGDPELDTLAASAIGRTLFPRPPDGMTQAQLTYVIPFHFR